MIKALALLAAVVLAYVGTLALIIAMIVRRLQDDEDMAAAEEFVAQLRALPDQDWPF